MGSGAVWHRFWKGNAGLSDKISPLGSTDNVKTCLHRAIANCNYTRALFVLQCSNDVLHDRRAAVVPALLRSECLNVFKILWRRSGKAFIAGGDGELSGVATDACGTALNNQSFTAGFPNVLGYCKARKSFWNNSG
ncbi:MAG: hypothetical protein Q9214_004160 [Letrouitia sp. 1 TL-2023]